MKFKKLILTLFTASVVLLASSCGQKLDDDKRILDEALGNEGEIVVEFDENKEIIEKVTASVKSQLKSELKEELRQELKAELKNEIKAEVESEIRSELESKLMRELSAKISSEVTSIEGGESLSESQIQSIVDSSINEALIKRDAELRKKLRKAITDDIRNELNKKRNKVEPIRVEAKSQAEEKQETQAKKTQKTRYRIIENIGRLDVNYSGQIASLQIDLTSDKRIPAGAIVTEIELSGNITRGQAVNVKKAISPALSEETFYTMNHLDVVDLRDQDLMARDIWTVYFACDTLEQSPLSWEPMVTVSYKY